LHYLYGVLLISKSHDANQNEESNLTASWAGGEVGGVAVEMMGEMIYERAYD
jgi:hypothetical protein